MTKRKETKPEEYPPEMLGALRLATNNTGRMSERGHAIINQWTKKLLAAGLMRYGSGRQAYVMTAKGRAVG